jgi:hypothetical protein
MKNHIQFDDETMTYDDSLIDWWDVHEHSEMERDLVHIERETDLEHAQNDLNAIGD